MLLRKFLLAALTICLQCSALAQVVVDHWTTDNGLPLNSIGAMCQTPDGYLWLGTPDGLARFDGVSFTTFDKSNTQGIQGNRICCMYCAPNGGFWAGTEGSGIIRYEQGSFNTFRVRDGLPSDTINGLTGDSHGNVWVMTQEGVSRWDRRNDRFVTLDRTAYLYDHSLGTAGQGFFGVQGTLLQLFQRGVRSVYQLPGHLNDRSVIRFGVDLNEQVWLESGAKLFRLADGRWLSFSPHPPIIVQDYPDSRNRIWRIENGWTVDGQFLQSVVLPDDTPSKVPFKSLFEDREGGVWLGTDGQGLYRLRDRMIQVISKEQGLSDRNVYTVLQARDGAMWMGTWTGGLTRLDGRKSTRYSTAQGLASGQVLSLGEDLEGRLWVAVLGGLYRRENNRFKRVEINSLRSEDQTVRAIYCDPQGVMWFGTNQGLLRYKDGTWKALTSADGLPGNDVRVIIPAREGGLWAAGYGGLSRLENGKIRAWTEDDGLPGNTIRSLYEDADGVLWIGSYDGGLGRFAEGRFTRYTVSEGLFNNGVFQILEDAHGNLWMSSNRGVYRVAKRELNDFALGKSPAISSIGYGREDGLLNIECNGGLWPAGVRARDGTLWFPTQDGVAIIDPEKLPPTPAPPPVIIESAMLEHKPVVERPVRVAPGYGNLEIEYTAPSFVDSERIRFRYQLKGLDHAWIAAGTRRTAYYPHLPPGHYSFRVTAAHSGGAWNAAVAEVPIVVLPAFYQTWWFRGLLLAAVAACIGLIWHHQIQQLERDRAAQHEFARRLIDSQENERKRIAAELHDSLGQRLVIIKNRALMLLHRHDGSPDLNGSQRNQLEDISAQTSEAAREVREITYDLRPYRLDRLGLTAALRAMIEAASDSGEMQFSSEIDEIDGVLPDQQTINFYRIVQECVSNVLKHSKASQAFVRVRCFDGHLELTVRDNGCGFTAKNSRNEIPGGFGLTTLSERAQLLGGNASIQSTSGQGTTVTVQISSTE